MPRARVRYRPNPMLVTFRSFLGSSDGTELHGRILPPPTPRFSLFPSTMVAVNCISVEYISPEISISVDRSGVAWGKAMNSPGLPCRWLIAPICGGHTGVIVASVPLPSLSQPRGLT